MYIVQITRVSLIQLHKVWKLNIEKIEILQKKKTFLPLRHASEIFIANHFLYEFFFYILL